MSSRIRNFGWNRLKLATLSYEEIKTLEEQVKSEHACSDGINMYDKAGRDKLDALKSKDDFGGEVVPVYTDPQPLTTSERAELENYRNTQQVVPEEIPRLHDGNKFKYVSGGIRFSSHYANGWNACRAAMLQGKAAGNSPVIQDGWKMVPTEPTEDMLAAAGSSVILSEPEAFAVYSNMLAAAPQQEVKS